MSSKLRLALPMACHRCVGGRVSAAAAAIVRERTRHHMNYAHLNKIQKRIISETLTSSLGPRSKAVRPHIIVPISDEDSGAGWRAVHAAEVVRITRWRRLDDQLFPVF